MLSSVTSCIPQTDLRGATKQYLEQEHDGHFGHFRRNKCGTRSVFRAIGLVKMSILVKSLVENRNPMVSAESRAPLCADGRNSQNANHHCSTSVNTENPTWH